MGLVLASLDNEARWKVITQCVGASPVKVTQYEHIPPTPSSIYRSERTIYDVPGCPQPLYPLYFCFYILNPWQLNFNFSLPFLIRCNLRIYQHRSNSAEKPLTSGKWCWSLTLLFSIILTTLISALTGSLCSPETLFLFSWGEKMRNKCATCLKVSDSS